ncbi:DUF971 domain-containing protein [Colwellia sp. D2M02]|uniref:DUF971 domain-containing protein n=1 Tax=Colwellia asteriadis TaxID=517723 RepID=A0ABN1L350_9GAMM|nr:gamma-butyrobetaine hydroxylase-like domain-containing protein [Colwellia sp. D2M02]MBU2893590.1 DUF971 domain-containing protein [Colwellia sp. D2M02]
MNIKRFTLNNENKILIIDFDNSSSYQLPYEYLRISSPSVKNSKGVKELICHKKQVQLSAIECVAKHGYRLLFNDNHSAIYSAEYLLQLATEHDIRWQDYLAQLANSGHSREAMIEIKQVQ